LATDFEKLPKRVQEALISRTLGNKWEKAIISIKRLLLRASSKGKTAEEEAIDEIVSSLKENSEFLLDKLQIARFGKVIGVTNPNLQPVKAMLRERRKLRNLIYSNIADNAKDDLSRLVFFAKHQIGRRGQDPIRFKAIEILEKQMLEGFGAKAVKEELSDFIQEYKKTLKGTKFFSSDDPKTFPLEIWPYKGEFRNYNIKNYAELVSITTAAEADTSGFIHQAKELGSNLVQYNYTGKDYSQDPRCALIDGKIFSTERGGSYGASGKKYPYIFSVLKPPYRTPHPHCRHTPRPIPKEDA
jgi:CRISPR/Cas system CSM-associated protein Csm2 small subunit